MRKSLILIALVGCVLFCGCGKVSATNEKTEQEEMAENIERAMYEVLGDDLKKMSKHELVATMTYGKKDGTGDGILYHMIKSTYFEADPAEVTGFNADAIGVLFDPEGADSCEEMKINEWAACRYRLNGKSFLCFTVDPEMTYVLEYNAEEVADDEILKMAESAKQPKEE